MRPDTDENNNVNDTGMFKTLLSYLKPRGLKILHQNVNGIISKIDKVKILLGETRKNVQILCITETKLNKHILDSEISVDGYIIVRRDRHSGPGGGVCMFIRNDLNWQRRNDLECETIETIWIEIFIKHSKSIIISVTYRPPDTSKYSNKNFNTTFHDLIHTAQVEDKEIILSRGFNCSYLKSSHHKDLKDIFKLNGLKQLIKQPTRTDKQSETLIDLILTTHEQNISNSFVYDHGISDHDLTGIIRKINCKKYEPRKIQTRNYKNFCRESYKDDLRNIPWENALRLTNLNQSWNHFKELVTDCIDRHAPRTQKKVTGKDCPWLTSQIKTTIHQRDFMLRKAKRTNRDMDWAEYKRIRNLVTSSIRKAKANYQRSLLRNSMNNPRHFWSNIKKAFPTKDTTTNTKSFKINNVITSDRSTIANAFCSFFTAVGSSMQQSVIRLYDVTWKQYYHHNLKQTVNPTNKTFHFAETEIKDVLTTLKSLKTSKAAGIDNIPPRLVKEGAEEIVAPLTMLLNRSLCCGVFPTSEKQAKISPIYKADSRSSLDNYRPISVLNVFSKIAERVVYTQLLKYLEENNMLSKHQYGFRAKRSTNHAVTRLVDDLRINMDKGLATGAIFMDLRKAFDTVHHSCLLTKLPCYGINGNQLNWFQDYLFNRSQVVNFDGVLSQPQHITYGVPQGSILGPLLFSILINDIDSVLKKSKIILYADDPVIYYGNKYSNHIQEALIIDADNITQWLFKNNLTLNLKKSKTELFLFGTPSKTKNNATNRNHYKS